MARLRQRDAVRAWRFVLVALLLVPLLGRAHTHDGEATKPASCAVCVATHHSPSLATDPVRCPMPAFRGIVLGAAPNATPASAETRSHRGRSPPAPLPTRFV